MLTFVYARLRTCTLQGVECRNKPGAKHRTGYLPRYDQLRERKSWASSVGLAGFTAPLAGSGAAPFCPKRRMRRRGGTWAASEVRKKSWKSRSLAKTYASALFTTSSAEAWR